MNARPTGVSSRSMSRSLWLVALTELSYGPTFAAPNLQSLRRTTKLNSTNPSRSTVTVSKDQDEGFEDILAELDREEARVKIRMEMRRFGKPTTVIEGIKMSDKDLHELNSKMKRALATGGTVKDGIMILQGDHRENAARMLKENGFSEGAIEII